LLRAAATASVANFRVFHNFVSDVAWLFYMHVPIRDEYIGCDGYAKLMATNPVPTQEREFVIMVRLAVVSTVAIFKFSHYNLLVYSWCGCWVPGTDDWPVGGGLECSLCDMKA